MKTEDLINLISEDTRRPVNISRALFIATTGGAFLAAIAFFSTLGFRHDIGHAVETVRFIFKFFVTLSLFGAAVSLIGATIRPGSNPGGRRWFLLVAPALLLGAVAVELYVTPASDWTEKLIGHNALHCITIIPALSLFPAVPLFLAMRNGAPESPGIAGAVAGLASAGIAATLYASNCFDDSPLFVAAWYPLAIMLVATIGFFSGHRWLHW
ncbi:MULTISPECIES: NrsF family protein [Rhizobium]|uniref:DUF1109 family protein n=1 Tax=Rhizobium lusitanum TaxID=293958 RepID=A0A1C3WUS1_9HYPH|nr:NrsF family protein [Rhizobium lusitanum]SCB43721.1 hypothetical protein GA0061101_117123 [Rhizobium lusitanum]